jgi:hypothetical protein
MGVWDREAFLRAIKELRADVGEPQDTTAIRAFMREIGAWSLDLNLNPILPVEDPTRDVRIRRLVEDAIADGETPSWEALKAAALNPADVPPPRVIIEAVIAHHERPRRTGPRPGRHLMRDVQAVRLYRFFRYHERYSYQHALIATAERVECSTRTVARILTAARRRFRDLKI